MTVNPAARALNALTRKIIAAAIEVHRGLGPGLLESAYRTCFTEELPHGGLTCQREVPIPVSYRHLHLSCGYRADFLVEEQVIVEVKAVELLTPVHKRQLQTYIQRGSASDRRDMSPRLHLAGSQRLLCPRSAWAGRLDRENT